MVIYCDTDSIVYKSLPGTYEPECNKYLRGMTDELGGKYIKEFVSNGAKTYAYETNTGEQVVKCKGFTLNKLASDQLTMDAMRHMLHLIMRMLYSSWLTNIPLEAKPRNVVCAVK